MPETEVRTITAEPLEWRAAGDDGTATIAGYGAVWNSPSYDLGGFKEIVAPGAFTRSLKSREDVFAFFNHSPMQPLGSRKAGNLKVMEDERGLHYEIKLPNTTYANDVAEGIRAGVIRGSSFSFQVREDAWHTEKGIQVRTLLDVDVSELGPVVMPAYGKTTAQVRSLLAERGITLDVDPHAPAARLADLLEGWPDMEPDEIRTAIAILTGRLPPAEDPPPAEPAPKHRLALARRRFETQRKLYGI